MRKLLTSLVAFMPGAALADVQAVASFSILGDLVSVVGGNHVTVTNLVGADEDAHVYSPTAADARAVASADIVFFNGLEFEGWSANLLAASETSAPIITIGENLPLILDADSEVVEGDMDHDDDHEMGEESHEGHKDEHHDDHEDEHHDEDAHEDEHHDDHSDDPHGHDHGEFDPHVWNSVCNVMEIVHIIEHELSEIDPANAAAYEANADAYMSELSDLQAGFQTRIDAIPAGARNVVTTHDAFGYLGAEMGLTFLAPQGLNSETEASAAEVRDLIVQLRTLPNAAIFVENIINPALIEQIASETGFGVAGTLYSDALSGPDGPARTYLEQYSYNLESILSELEN